MRQTLNWLAAPAVVVMALTACAAPASAGCQRFGFSVNDYGKDGPAKDAKSLLDKHISKKLAERGITKFTTGTKSVNCEMFLNFIVFDEYTCTAEATACWDGAPLPAGETTAAVDATAGKPKPDAAKAAGTKPVSSMKTTAAKPAVAKTEPVKAEAAKPAAEAAPAADAAKPTSEPAKAADAPAAATDPAKPAAQ